jgi:hypothetical protein
MKYPLSPESQKENVSFKFSRVTGHQKDLKHSDSRLSLSPLPSARPLESSLENSKSSVVMSTPLVALEGQDSKDGPMTSITYLKSPLETLLESMVDPESEHVSIHDLIEAYNILSIRIRSQIQVILEPDQTLPALDHLKKFSTELLQSLRRDIRRALVNPSSNPRGSSLSENSLLSINQVSESEIKYARDLSLLCHHALCFLSLVFSIQAMYSIFPSMYILVESASSNHYLLNIQQVISAPS